MSPGTTGTVQVASITGLPAHFPFRLIAEPGTSNAEIIRITQAATGSGPYSFANSVRGDDGTSAPAHSNGAAIAHGIGAGDVWQQDWINVCTADYGADPTGTNDSTTAINSALTGAAVGQPVYLPTGIYKVSAPILIPPGGVLLGDYSGEVTTYLDFLMGTVIQPTSAWSNGSALWDGVISMIGQTQGSYSTPSEEQKITGIMVDCHLMTGSSVDGIQLYGAVNRVHLERVLVANPPANGVNFVTDGSSNTPGAPRLDRVTVRYAGNYGFYFNKVSDATARDCLAENCTSDGWNLVNVSNGIFVADRSEHNGSAGAGNGFTFTCTNSSTGSGTLLLDGCSTDRNEGYGIKIFSTNSSGVPAQLVGCRFRRDGRNSNSGGGGLAGIYITAYPGTVQISGCSVWPGVDDNGTGTNSPATGLLIASNSASGNVIVGSTYLQAQTNAISDDGTSAQVEYGLDVLAATGTTSSPTVFGPRTGSGALGTGGTATVACTSVRTSSVVLLTWTSQGANSGTVTSVTKNVGTGFTVTSNNTSDRNSFNWMVTTP